MVPAPPGVDPEEWEDVRGWVRAARWQYADMRCRGLSAPDARRYVLKRYGDVLVRSERMIGHPDR